MIGTMRIEYEYNANNILFAAWLIHVKYYNGYIETRSNRG